MISSCLELLILWALVDLTLRPLGGLRIPQSGDLLGSKLLHNQGHVFFCHVSVSVSVCVCVCVLMHIRALTLGQQVLSDSLQPPGL